MIKFTFKYSIIIEGRNVNFFDVELENFSQMLDGCFLNMVKLNGRQLYKSIQKCERKTKETKE